MHKTDLQEVFCLAGRYSFSPDIFAGHALVIAPEQVRPVVLVHTRTVYTSLSFPTWTSMRSYLWIRNSAQSDSQSAVYSEFYILHHSC